ncbi:lipopolysaccharide biosynthesis protein [Candidatus Magnetominusculus dajiuhuensis]|uniref:lipopolysaccharide biosynthesis protein n=1 Tax=Candidatus Magnetominusculus dajiuhuensis TaxID=3137712 RepID=UPI003B42FE3B
MKDSDTLVKNITRYAASNMFQRACGIVNTFIKPKLLPPELYGLWNLISIITTYATYAHLGTRNAMFYLLPYHKSRNETTEGNDIKSAVFYGSMFLSVIITVGVWIYAFSANLNKMEQAGLLSVGILIILNCIFDYQFNEISADKRFKLISSINYKKSVIAVILNAGLIYYLSIYGMYLSALLSVLIMVVYMHMVSPIKLIEPFKKAVFFELTKKGLPILVYNVSNDLISSIDKIIIAYLLGVKELGYYSITGLVFNFLVQIPGDAREVVEVDLMGSVTTSKREDTLDDYFFKPLSYTSHFMPFLLGPSFFLIVPFIHMVLPKYIQGIVPTQIVTIGSYFFALAFIARGIIISHNKQFHASIVISAVLVFNGLAAVSFIKMGYGTVGVACGSSLSFFILFIALYIFVRSFYSNISFFSWFIKIRDVFILFLIMVFVIAALAYISSIVPVNKYISAALSTVLYCLAMYGVSAWMSPDFIHQKIVNLIRRRRG